LFKKAVKAMTGENLLKEAKRFNYWFYPYDLGDGKKIRATDPLYDKLQKIRLQHVLLDAVNKIGFNSLDNLRILDCGCNSGFFSFECARLGASYVLGLESKEEFLQQANLLNSYFNYSSVSFQKMDLSEIMAEKLGQFDIVLLMSAIEYLQNTVSFFKEICQITKKYLILESLVLPFEHSHFYLRYFPSVPHYPAGGDFAFNLLPSIGALMLLLSKGGFSSFRMLSIHDVHREYRMRERLAIVASKEKEKDFVLFENFPAVHNNRDWKRCMAEIFSINRYFKYKLKAAYGRFLKHLVIEKMNLNINRDNWDI
jgi:SAM-dependent methyltransferase